MVTDWHLLFGGMAILVAIGGLFYIIKNRIIDIGDVKRNRIEKEIEMYQFILTWDRWGWFPGEVIAPNNLDRDEYFKRESKFLGLGRVHPDIQDKYDKVVAYKNRKTNGGKTQLERDYEKHEATKTWFGIKEFAKERVKELRK